MLVKELVWKEESRCNGENKIFFAKMPQGTFSVLDRMTGYGIGIRDTETGFRDIDNKFWLASGMMDIRHFPEITIEDAIELVKREANICAGV